MSSSPEDIDSLQPVSSVDEHIGIADTNEQNSGVGSDAARINSAIFGDNENVLVVSSPSDSQANPILFTTSFNTLQDEEERPRATTIDIRSNSERHPREWNRDEVLGWFQSYKLTDLYNSLFYPDESKDGAALNKIFELKLKNYERYKARYTSRLDPKQDNLLKDFDRFGQLLDTYFIDKYAYRFDVAFSFPGNLRDQVKRIAEKLCAKINTRMGEQRVFYDNYHKAELARPNLDLYLQTIYRYQTRLIVVFMCDEYKCREWCGLESRAIRGLLKAHQSTRIMLLTVDGKTIDGVFDIDGYLDISKETDDYVADAIYWRLKELGEPLSPSRSSRPLPPPPPPPKTIISKIIMASKNAFRSTSPWYLVIALSSYILATLIRR